MERRAAFSQRQGLKPVRPFQVNAMDAELRNGLWSAFYVFYCCKWGRVSVEPRFQAILRRLWVYHLKKPIDELENSELDCVAFLRGYFFDCPWNEVYDLIEATADEDPDPTQAEEFRAACNVMLEEEVAGYRFVAGRLIPVTSESEIQQIEAAAALDGPLAPAAKHIKDAAALLAHRGSDASPGYRNSIKESISAVEAICRLIVGEPKAPLGKALKVLDQKITAHHAFRTALEKLYAYTCDADGIRHALHDEPQVGQEDATFMLVVCSALVNYLVEKARRAGVMPRAP